MGRPLGWTAGEEGARQVHDVHVVLSQHGSDSGPARKGDTHLRIAGYRQAWHDSDWGPGVFLRWPMSGGSGREDNGVDAPHPEMLQNAKHGVGHTVDMRKEGLRDHAYAHALSAAADALSGGGSHVSCP